MSHALTCTRHRLSGGACRGSFGGRGEKKAWSGKDRNLSKSMKKFQDAPPPPISLYAQELCAFILFFSIESASDFHLTSELNIPDLTSLLFNTGKKTKKKKKRIHSNQQSNSRVKGEGAAGISSTPEIPDILTPWDLLSYLLWESEFMMSKLGSFICVPGGLQRAAEMA